jgi:hypothetical protein
MLERDRSRAHQTKPLLQLLDLLFLLLVEPFELGLTCLRSLSPPAASLEFGFESSNRLIRAG